MILDPRQRTAERSWFEEFDDLEAAGFVWRSEYSSGTRTCFCCGEDMEVRLFERRGRFLPRIRAVCHVWLVVRAVEETAIRWSSATALKGRVGEFRATSNSAE